MKRFLDFLKGHRNISLALNVILLGSTIYLCFRNYSLKKQLSRYQPLNKSTVIVSSADAESRGQDVVRLSTTTSEYKNIPRYKSTSVVKEVLYWDSSSFVDSSSSINTLMDTQLQDSLTQMILDNKTLELSFLRPSIQKFLTQTYRIDVERYKYNWTLEDGLTYQKNKVLELYPYFYGKYKVFQKSPDLGVGLTLKTTRIDYNLGFSVNSLGKDNKMDLEISVNYRFNKWLK